MYRGQITRKIISLICISVLSFLTGYLALYFISFSNDDGGIIKNVEVTNLGYSSFTVSWETEKPVVSEIMLSQKDNFLELFPRLSTGVQFFYHDRDDLNNLDTARQPSAPKRFHHVTVSGLEPETQYFFRILGQFKAFEFGVPVVTRAIPEQLQQPRPIYGRALNHFEGESFTQDGFVRMYLQNGEFKSQLMSSTINTKNGGWQQDLANIVLENGTQFIWSEMADTKIFFDIFTSDGEGVGFGDLGEGRVIPNIFYNVLYIPNVDLIVSTDP